MVNARLPPSYRAHGVKTKEKTFTQAANIYTLGKAFPDFPHKCKQTPPDFHYCGGFGASFIGLKIFATKILLLVLVLVV